jgi:hypothetical protein
MAIARTGAARPLRRERAMGRWSDAVKAILVGGSTYSRGTDAQA